MEKTMNIALLKICSSEVKNSYKKKGDVQRVINYVLQDCKRADNNIWDSIGTYNKSKTGIIKDFYKLKRLYGKTDGLQLKHLVLSWGIQPDIPRKKLRKLIKRTINYWGKDYQLVYAVHEDRLPKGWHIHIVINSVSYNGYKIQINRKTLEKFIRQFNNIWNTYGYELYLDRHNQEAVADKSFECS